MLGRSYLVMARYQDAVDAYRNARKYIGDDSQLLADYAEVLILANNNSFTEEAANLVQVKQNAGMVYPDEDIAVSELTETSVSGIDVHVNLDSALLENAGPEDTVFIFARASAGPRMPLAIVRKQVKDLPVKVTLDDSTAMSPDMSLSKFKQVVISARVSKNGDAMPRSGDLSGSSAIIQLSEVTGVKITIDQILP
jgi:cytochrome c-type biogenesis protein CcmH